MYEEQFSRLAEKSKAGDKLALIALLRLAHTPISFQCRKLLRNELAAEELTRQILSALPNQLSHLSDPVAFEKWICRITASRCMQALSKMDRSGPDDMDRPADPPMIAARNLDEAQTAQVVQQLVDDLPEAPRICLLLYSCGGLKLKGISQLTDYPESQVLEYLNQAQKSINTQMRKYHRMGVHFAPIPALSTLLRTTMYNSRDTRAAAIMVSSILMKKVPASKKTKHQKKIPSKLLIAVLAAATVLLMLLVTIFLLEGRHQAVSQAMEIAAFVTCL